MVKNWRRSALRMEALESRDLMSSDPLPVLLVIADRQDFYYQEYGHTRQSLQAAGLTVQVAATTTQPSMPHPNSGQPAGQSGVVVPNLALSAVQPQDYSAIVFVGGWGASMYQYSFNDPDFDGDVDNFYTNPQYNADSNMTDGKVAPQKQIVNKLIGAFLDDDKPVAAICHGTTVLAWARVDGQSPIAGKHVSVPVTTGTPQQFYNGEWWSGGYAKGQYDQAIHNGAIPNTKSGQYGDPTTNTDDVIVDGRIITAENQNSALHFGTIIAQEVLANIPNEAPVVANAAWRVAANTTVGATVGTVSATNAESDQTLTFAIVGGNSTGAFAIDSRTGRITVANPAAVRSQSQFGLKVRAIDNGAPAQSGEARISITVSSVTGRPTLFSDDELAMLATAKNEPRRF